MKKAVLFLVEGPHDIKLGLVREKMVNELSIRGYAVRSSEYNFEHPPPTNEILGQMVKFATGYHSSDNGKTMEENLEEERIGFKAWLKPIIKQMGKEIWYGPKNVPKEPDQS